MALVRLQTCGDPADKVILGNPEPLPERVDLLGGSGAHRLNTVDDHAYFPGIHPCVGQILLCCLRHRHNIRRKRVVDQPIDLLAGKVVSMRGGSKAQ